jgi:hypothetical protein
MLLDLSIDFSMLDPPLPTEGLFGPDAASSSLFDLPEFTAIGVVFERFFMLLSFSSLTCEPSFKL